MKWIRSWPSAIPPRRSYVVDQLERVEIANYDYAPLLTIDDDLLMLEWDIAVSREDMERFALYCEGRDTPLVAPYRLYDQWPPQWCHRQVIQIPSGGRHVRWVQQGEPTCNYYSLGCVYLPRDYLAAFARYREETPDRPDARFTDNTLSQWHHDIAKLPPVSIVWNIKPVHLNWG